MASFCIQTYGRTDTRSQNNDDLFGKDLVCKLQEKIMLLFVDYRAAERIIDDPTIFFILNSM